VCRLNERCHRVPITVFVVVPQRLTTSGAPEVIR
jgi:hypothetical protein